MGSRDDFCFVVKDKFTANSVKHPKKESMSLRLGTLVYVVDEIDERHVSVRLDTSDRRSNFIEETLWTCPIFKILPFCDSLKPYILAISNPRERVRLVENEELFIELTRINVNDKVYYIPPQNCANLNSTKGKKAVVKFKGLVPSLGSGVYFGLKLLDLDLVDEALHPIGISYGKKCHPEADVCVAINHLQICVQPTTLCRQTKPTHLQLDVDEKLPFRTCDFKETRARFENMSRSSQLPCSEPTEKLIDLSPNHSPVILDQVPLKEGERVVYVTDTGHEHGVVRWLGQLDQTGDLQAGVEFDNPIGRGNLTEYVTDSNGKKIFQAKKGHGCLMPVMGLVKADDMYQQPPSAGVKKNKKSSCSLTSGSTAAEARNASLSRSKGVLGPDQLYSAKYQSTMDSPDDHVCSNGSITSSLDRNIKKLLESETNRKKDKIINDPDTSNRAMSSSKLSTSTKCDPFNYISPGENLDMSDNMKSKGSPSPRGWKTNEICDGERSNLDWSGSKNRMWPLKSKLETKTDYDCSAFISNGKCSQLNDWTPSCPLHITDDTDGELITSRSPSDNSIGGGRGFYDTPVPDSSEDFRDYRESPEFPSHTSSDLGIGSVVEVVVKGDPLYGVIRWLGILPDDRKGRRVAGIEMEEERPDFSDGVFKGQRYFTCNPHRALFVNLHQCQKDGRFQEPTPGTSVDCKSKTTFGQKDCPVIPGVVRPVAVSGDLQSKCGKFHGIQGHHNSCYLDATLFSMFTFTSVFDGLLYRPATERDCVQYEEVQRVLREEIVNPLRTKLFVRADRVMKLRTLLENNSSVTGLTSEEKDPEEFLNSLVAQILRAEPFLKLSSGQEAYHYQLFVEKDEQLKFPSVQKLFEQSFLASDIKLKEVPSCLIIQMPRFGKSFKMYPRILPSQVLDVTDVIEDSPRQCTVCGKLAEYECKQCMDHCDAGLENIAYCEPCLKTAHSHHRRSNHVWKQLSVPEEFRYLEEASSIPRLYMELFAVVCIETSHYVAFVKCGAGSDAPWCFFDSMADRKGEQNGYNIPEMVPCADLPFWLSDKGAQSMMAQDNRQLPEHAKRLFCDAYMCMYQSSDVMMYR